MSRTKGATNKKLSDHPEYLDMGPEERLSFIANLIVDQLLDGSASATEISKALGIEEAAV